MVNNVLGQYSIKIEGVTDPAALSGIQAQGAQLIRDYDLLAANFETDLVAALLAFVVLEPAPAEIGTLLPSCLFYPASWDEWHLGMPRGGPPSRTLSALAARLDRLFDPPPGRPGGKQHLDPSDALWILRDVAGSNLALKWGNQLATFCDPAELSSITIANLLLAPCDDVIRDDFVSLFFSYPGILSSDLLTFTKAVKDIHVTVRQFGRLPHIARFLPLSVRRHWYGVDQLPGRSMRFGKSLANEVIMRMLPFPSHAAPVRAPFPKTSPLRDHTASGFVMDPEKFQLLVSEEIDRAVSDVVHARVRAWPSLREHVANRFSWASDGGAPGYRVILDGLADRVSKKAAMYAVATDDLLSLLNTPAPDVVLHSRGAIKYEPGKERAIWNTSVEHYVLSDYILAVVEDAGNAVPWYASSHDGPMRLVSDIQRVEDLRSGACLMWDFSDFNITHSLRDQARVFRAIGLALGSNYQFATRAEPEWSRILEWVALSHEHIVMDVPRYLIAEVLRSMMSGIRGTSFVNTILNRAYIRATARVGEMLLGYPLLRARSWHQGDDVWLNVSSHLAGIIFSGLINLLGFAGATNKIMANLRSSGEFLRRLYALPESPGDRALVSGYPLRALFGLVSGEYFAESVVDPNARLAAYQTQIGKIYARGIDLRSSSALTRLARRNCVLVRTRPDGSKDRLAASPELALTSAVLGGQAATNYRLFDVAGNYGFVQAGTLTPSGRLRFPLLDFGLPYPKFAPPHAPFSKLARSARPSIHDYELLGQLVPAYSLEAADKLDRVLTRAIWPGNLPTRLLRPAYDKYFDQLQDFYSSVRTIEVDLGSIDDLRRSLRLNELAGRVSSWFPSLFDFGPGLGDRDYLNPAAAASWPTSDLPARWPFDIPNHLFGVLKTFATRIGFGFFESAAIAAAEFTRATPGLDALGGWQALLENSYLTARGRYLRDTPEFGLLKVALRDLAGLPRSARDHALTYLTGALALPPVQLGNARASPELISTVRSVSIAYLESVISIDQLAALSPLQVAALISLLDSLCMVIYLRSLHSTASIDVLE